jgi:hypothetical protein
LVLLGIILAAILAPSKNGKCYVPDLVQGFWVGTEFGSGASYSFEFISNDLGFLVFINGTDRWYYSSLSFFSYRSFLSYLVLAFLAFYFSVSILFIFCFLRYHGLNDSCTFNAGGFKMVFTIKSASDTSAVYSRLYIVSRK